MRSIRPLRPVSRLNRILGYRSLPITQFFPIDYEPFFDFEVEEAGERGYGCADCSIFPPYPRSRYSLRTSPLFRSSMSQYAPRAPPASASVSTVLAL